MGQNSIDEDAISFFSSIVSEINEEVITTLWKYIGGMGGIYMTGAIGRGALVFKGQIGYASVASYSLNWFISNGSQYAQFEVESVRTGSAVFDVEIMTMLPVSEVVFLNIGIDYFNTTPRFKMCQ